MPGKSKTSKDRINARERQGKALEMRKAGYTYQVIADNLGYYDRAAAEKAVRRALERITEEPAKEVLKLELERLDAMLTQLWNKVGSGKIEAFDRVLKIMDRRARYLGLDKGEKFDSLGEIQITIKTPDRDNE
jgi:transcriptional regulator